LKFKSLNERRDWRNLILDFIRYLKNWELNIIDAISSLSQKYKEYKMNPAE